MLPGNIWGSGQAAAPSECVQPGVTRSRFAGGRRRWLRRSADRRRNLWRAAQRTGGGEVRFSPRCGARVLQRRSLPAISAVTVRRCVFLRVRRRLSMPILPADSARCACPSCAGRMVRTYTHGLNVKSLAMRIALAQCCNKKETPWELNGCPSPQRTWGTIRCYQAVRRDLGSLRDGFTNPIDRPVCRIEAASTAHFSELSRLYDAYRVFYGRSAGGRARHGLHSATGSRNRRNGISWAGTNNFFRDRLCAPDAFHQHAGHETDLVS